MTRDGKLCCDGKKGCESPITHMDEKGFIYCAIHGAWRKQYMRCRKLKPAELKTLQSGKPLTKY
jgi:hypothetical protein